MGHPPPIPYGPPPGAPPPTAPRRGPGPLVFVLIAAAVAVLLLITGAVAYVIVTGDDGDSGPAASGPVDLREPLTFSLVDEVSQPPCKAGARTVAGDTSCYTFGGDELTVRRLEAVKAVAPDPARGAPGWTVQLTLNDADRPGFAALTGKAAQGYASRAPSGRMGMLIGETLISPPAQVMQAITGGQVQITGPAGTFTRSYTEGLVRRMTGR
ncbi:hypothetical protein HUT06_16465 [Actinomadura sp. NAK00032]|uniref:hypothetical protein n=1 Tax=Actinomadura sp. NAK00032 TaxID=2742128 RepID=UPI0015927C8B|nr:hypothetical protein [Actinomadura sp. NAK00032]QKW35437.1 hypothetical protein HUT06_16465 [Actinomadura sp. NAK00032]